MVNTPSRKKTILSEIRWFRSISQEVSARSGSLSHNTLNMLADERKQASDPTFEMGHYLCFIGHKKLTVLDFGPHKTSCQCGQDLWCYSHKLSVHRHRPVVYLKVSMFTWSLQDRITQEKKGTRCLQCFRLLFPLSKG